MDSIELTWATTLRNIHGALTAVVGGAGLTLGALAVPRSQMGNAGVRIPQRLVGSLLAVVLSALRICIPLIPSDIICLFPDLLFASQSWRYYPSTRGAAGEK